MLMVPCISAPPPRTLTAILLTMFRMASSIVNQQQKDQLTVIQDEIVSNLTDFWGQRTHLLQNQSDSLITWLQMCILEGSLQWTQPQHQTCHKDSSWNTDADGGDSYQSHHPDHLVFLEDLQSPHTPPPYSYQTPCGRQNTHLWGWLCNMSNPAVAVSDSAQFLNLHRKHEPQK